MVKGLEGWAYVLDVLVLQVQLAVPIDPDDDAFGIAGDFSGKHVSILKQDVAIARESMPFRLGTMFGAPLSNRPRRNCPSTYQSKDKRKRSFGIHELVHDLETE